MTDDREPFREARAAGLKARHEQRLENATYTAAEVKVLTEAALRLGRKEAGEEIAQALEAQRKDAESRVEQDGEISFMLAGTAAGLAQAARIAREITAQPSDTTSGRTDPGMDSDLPQDSQAVRSPQGDSNG